ncbi:MAG: DUF883 family protein [Pseudobdellovibrionaceae bacterium]
METTPNIGNMKENIKKGVKHELDSGVWQDRYKTVQKKALQAVDTSEDYIKDHPFYSILGAATVGFVAAMLFRRKS